MSINHFDHINALVLQAKEHDNDALEELLEFYKPLMSAAVRKCIYSDHNLVSYKDDLKSMANLEFIKLVQSFDISRSFFSYYISNRLYPNLLKSSKTLVAKNHIDQPVEVLFSEMPVLWDPETTDPFGQIELQIIMMQALKKIDVKYQECINLVFYEQISQEEAAARLDITQSAFSKRLKKALILLKKIINDNFDFME